jgi:hypothetical protein
MTRLTAEQKEILIQHGFLFVCPECSGKTAAGSASVDHNQVWMTNCGTCAGSGVVISLLAKSLKRLLELE